MGFWKKTLLSILILALYFWNPFYVRSTVVDVAYAALHSANLAKVNNPNSLKAAISNVTGDFDQLASLLEDFFDRLPSNSTELLFREYLRNKAAQSHKDFEYCLDWLLSLYNIFWPFVAMYAILKLSNKDDGGPSPQWRRPKDSQELSLPGRVHGGSADHSTDPERRESQEDALR